MRARLLAVMAVLSILVLLITQIGCASSSAPVATTPAAPAAQPKYGGVLRYWLGAPPAGFDVHRKPSYSPIFGRLVFNNLIQFNPDKVGINPDNFAPALAEKWSVSADGKVITFNLRQGVKWHDGTPFSADDVMYNLEKMADPKRSALPASISAYDRAEKVDANTVKVYLKTPSPSYLVQMAGPYSSIEPKHRGDVDQRTPDFLVGTGPFMYKASVSGVSYELVKNPNYFMKGLPYLDGIAISIIADRSAQVDAFAGNRIDMTSTLNGVANQEVYEKFTGLIKDAVMEPVMTQQDTMFWFNLDYAPLKDVRVRKALALLMDPKELATVGFGGEKWADFNYGFMPSAYGLPKAEIDKILGRDKPMDTRIAEAKKLMADAGFANGFKLRMVSRNLAENVREVTLLADLYTRSLNIQAEIISRDATEARKMRDAKDYHMYFDQALMLLGEPDELMPMFVSGDPNNFTGYNNPAVDQMWKQQSQEMDMTKRRQLCQNIERQVLTDLPCLPTFHTVYFDAWRPYVRGYVVQDASYGSSTSFEKTWLDK